MPRVAVKTAVRMTKAQWKAWAERAVTKSGAITPQARKEAFNFKPPMQGTPMTSMTIKDPAGETGMSQFIRVPAAEGREAFHKSPELFSPHKGGPPTRTLRPSEPGEEALGRTIGPEIPRFGRRLVYEESKNLPTTTKKAKRDHLIATSAAEIQTDEAHAERLWGIIGGGRAIGGKHWKKLWQSSKQKDKYETAEDYFKSCFHRWRTSPRSLTKNAQSRERRLLADMWKVYGEGIPDGVVK